MQHKTKILFILPHCSTGGLPAYALWKVRQLKETHEICIIEWQNLSDHYTTHRRKIQELVDRYYIVNKNVETVYQIIIEFKPDIIRAEEYIDFGEELSNSLTNGLRPWDFIQSTHNVNARPNTPADVYVVPSQYLVNEYSQWGVQAELDEMELDPVEVTPEIKARAQQFLSWNPNHKHVVMVGIWNSYKNQSELMDIAHKMIGQPVEFHFVGTLAENFKTYWEPLAANKPINAHVYGERSDVDTFYAAADCMYFASTYELNPLVVKEAFAHGLVVLSRALDVYSSSITSHHLFMPINNNTVDNQRKLENVLGLPYRPFTIDRTNGIRVNVHPAEVETEYKVEFSIGNDLVFSTGITGGCFAKPNDVYNRNWTVKINGEVQDTSLTDKSVRVIIDSKSIGDTLAWLPQAIRFGQEHNVGELSISTYHNDLFDYPDVKLVSPSYMEKYDAVFKIGFFYDDFKHRAPKDQRTIPLGQVASDILGIPYVEARPILKNLSEVGAVGLVYICSESTAAAKLWNRPNGWQDLVNMLVESGYKVVHIGTKPSGLIGCEELVGLPLTELVKHLSEAQVFIGLASGMSWLAWACKVPVILISGFSDKYAEFTDKCYRIGPGHDACNAKCWNNINFKFDRGDWNWCPVFKGYPDQFSCTKSITPNSVYYALQILTDI